VKISIPHASSLEEFPPPLPSFWVLSEMMIHPVLYRRPENPKAKKEKKGETV
jgi:hypothetical protein